MKKIALFGGSGFVGLNFIQEKGHKYDITVFGRKDSHEFYVNNTLYPYTHTDYQLLELESIIKEFDLVVNLSAAKVRKGLTLPDYMESAYIADKLMQACLQVNCKKYIHISSRLVYKINAASPWKESSPEEPMNYYGIAKLVSDKLLLLYNKRNESDMISLRASQVYGLLDGEIDPGQKESLIIKCIEHAEDKVAQKILERAVGARDYLYVKDLVKAIDLAIQSESANGIYNIASGEKHSPLDVAKIVNKIYDNSSGIKLISGGVYDSMLVELDITKARAELNYNPDYCLSQGILDMKKKRGAIYESK